MRTASRETIANLDLQCRRDKRFGGVSVSSLQKFSCSACTQLWTHHSFIKSQIPQNRGVRMSGGGGSWTNLSGP